MHRTMKCLAVAALLAVSTSGCSDFLSGPTVDQDPNNPLLTQSTNSQIFAGFQATQFTNFAGTRAMTVCGFVQQCKGVNSRFVENQLVDYIFDPTTFDIDWIQLYGSGGLNDLRFVRTRLEAEGDQVWSGITKVWEALIMSEAADQWGDIPFTEAAAVDVTNPSVNITPPRLDSQLDIYTAALGLLDQAIADLAGAGPGPGAADFVYGGDPTAWTALAHTLKARILLHRVRADCGAALNGCPNYAQAAVEAAAGIQQGGLDFTTVTSGTGALESNPWFAFYAFSGFGGDLRAGDYFVDTMSVRNGGAPDPRFSTYFATPTEAGQAEDGEGFYIRLSHNRTSTANRPQPWVTQDENTLIWAEALLFSGDPGGALGKLNEIRTKYGLPALGAFGASPINDIIFEKYVTLFQNWEVWNDYKRHCFPVLSPTGDSTNPNDVPRRIFYSQSEQDSNPNVPTASDQLGGGGTQSDGTPVNGPEFRNRNDPLPPNGCAPPAA